MSSIDIYDILKSKPHNPHYLSRYYKFIVACSQSKSDEYYVEQHHICPKANDLFPGYSDLKDNPWNGVDLTARQHILAHILLWKAYQCGSQVSAVHYMLNVQNADTISFNKRKVPASISIRYAAKAREEFYSRKLGCSTYKDAEGNQYYLHESDPKIQELNLVGFRSGVVFTDDHKQRLSDSKLLNRKVTLTFLDLTRTVSLFSEDYDNHIAQGWLPKEKKRPDGVLWTADVDREYRKDCRYARRSNTVKGTCIYQYPDGSMFGSRLYPDDPRISQLNLTKFVADQVRVIAKENIKKAQDANTGTAWYNNGEINKKFKVDPGGEWVLGQLPYAEGALDLRKKRASESNLGSKTYNDGTRNYRVMPGDYIDPSWSPGMAPQKTRKKVDYSRVEIWNDGTRNYRVFPGEFVDPSWVRGMVKGTKKRMKYTNGIDIIHIYSGDDVPAGYKKATKDQIESLPIKQ